jgi:glycosyltransferase involved in cell wall biosynthesis
MALPFSAEVETTFETQSEGSSGIGVTVIVTLYNYTHFITDALNSVLKQTHRNIELIIVDDHSTDESERIAREWTSSHRARFACAKVLRHRANYGLAQCRNTAFENARNEWVFVLDADNEIYSTALEKLLKAGVTANAEAAYSQLEYFGATSGIGAADIWERDAFLKGNYVDAMALVGRAAWSAVGGYSDLEFGWEDYDFWCKFIEHDFKGIYVPEILCRYRVHKSSMMHRETNPNVASLISQMTFRHPWLELELDSA